MNPLLQQLASTGVVGLVAAIFLYLYLAERKVSQKEFHSRIEDAQKYSSLAMALQKEVITAVQALTKIAAHLEKQDEQKERLERELALRGGDTGPFPTVAPNVLRPPRPRGRGGGDSDE